MRSSEEGSRRRACIVDVDGTLIDSSERFRNATRSGRIDWSRALDPELVEALDKPMPDAIVRKIVEKCREMCDIVIVLTGRPRRLEKITRKQLREIGFRYDMLVMRSDNDFTDEVGFKLRKLRELSKHYDIVAIFDDNLRFLIAARAVVPTARLFHVTKDHVYELPTISIWSLDEKGKS
ncbi:MAG: hypothetical protein GXO23_05940 [Crenarchaeota archaeon]|nr:hypothetical protein [Thermoproteota archaeon]